MSAYRIETWTKKGYTEEEAKYQIAIRRPSNKLYWINKGFSEEEAIVKMKGHQKLGGKSAASRPIEEIRKTSMRCKEYWLEHGYNDEEAKIKVGEVQAVFSLDKCILRHGEIEGTKIFNDRQIKWQNTLNSKTTEEIETINKTKSLLSYFRFLSRGLSIEEAKIEMKKFLLSKSYTFFETQVDFENYVLSEFKLDPFLYFYPIDLLVKKFSRKQSFFILWDEKFDVKMWLTENIKLKNPTGEIITKRSSNWPGTGIGQWVMWTKGGKYLRSSNEIYFYQLLEECGFQEDVDYEIEKRYPNSRMRCDFYFIKNDVWLELAGSSNEEYIQKMLFKQNTWGAEILYEKQYYADFIEKLE